MVDVSRIQFQLIEDVGLLLAVAIGVAPVYTAATIPCVGQVDVIDAILEIEAVPEDRRRIDNAALTGGEEADTEAEPAAPEGADDDAPVDD